MSNLLHLPAPQAAHDASYLADRETLDAGYLRVARTKLRTAFTIGDARKRNRALDRIAADLTSRPWRPGEVRDAALNLAAAIDDVTMRAMPLEDLVAVVGKE